MNVDFVPFLLGVRVFCKPRLIFSRINGPSNETGFIVTLIGHSIVETSSVLDKLWRRVLVRFLGIKTSTILGFHMTSRPPCWCPKQRKGGHVGAPTKSSGNSTLLLCKRFLLFSLKNMAVDHVSENQQYVWYALTNYLIWCVIHVKLKRIVRLDANCAKSPSGPS